MHWMPRIVTVVLSGVVSTKFESKWKYTAFTECNQYIVMGDQRISIQLFLKLVYLLEFVFQSLCQELLMSDTDITCEHMIWVALTTISPEHLEVVSCLAKVMVNSEVETISLIGSYSECTSCSSALALLIYSDKYILRKLAIDVIFCHASFLFLAICAIHCIIHCITWYLCKSGEHVPQQTKKLAWTRAQDSMKTD